MTAHLSSSSHAGRIVVLGLASFSISSSVSSAFARAPLRLRGLDPRNRRVSEEVAVRDVDQIVKDMAKSRATREAVDAEIRRAQRLQHGGQGFGSC